MIIKIEVLVRDPDSKWSCNKVQMTDDKIGTYTVHLSHNSLKKEELKLKMRNYGAKENDIEAMYECGYDDGKSEVYECYDGESL